jgi:hypothetical protein
VRRLPIAHQRLAYALAPVAKALAGAGMAPTNAVNAVAFARPFRALAMACQYLA